MSSAVSSTSLTPPATTIAFLAAALNGMRLVSGRSGRLDLFADRLVRAASEPTLAIAMEHLLRAADVSADDLPPQLTSCMLAIAHSPDGLRVLRWWREQAKLVTLLAATKDASARDAALAGIVLPTAVGSGTAVVRGAFDITVRAVCETPLAHGGDGKAGNATLFRRMHVLSDCGAVLHLPYYAGNAVRGQIRDLLADHFLAALGIGRASGELAVWFFYAIYAGGALEESSDATKALRRSLGDHGAIRSTGIREFRVMLPALSLLGCALGNRVLNGHCQVGDLRPACVEWGTGNRPVAELTTWDFLTRREDDEDHLTNHAMIANTEYLRAGAVLEGGIDYDDSMASVERAALGRGLLLLAARGQLGAENRRGAGRVTLTIEGAPDPAEYDAYLRDRATEIRSYLGEIGALAAQ